MNLNIFDYIVKKENLKQIAESDNYIKYANDNIDITLVRNSNKIKQVIVSNNVVSYPYSVEDIDGNPKGQIILDGNNLTIRNVARAIVFGGDSISSKNIITRDLTTSMSVFKYSFWYLIYYGIIKIINYKCNDLDVPYMSIEYNDHVYNLYYDILNCVFTIPIENNGIEFKSINNISPDEFIDLLYYYKDPNLEVNSI